MLVPRNQVIYKLRIRFYRGVFSRNQINILARQNECFFAFFKIGIATLYVWIGSVSILLKEYRSMQVYFFAVWASHNIFLFIYIYLSVSFSLSLCPNYMPVLLVFCFSVFLCVYLYLSPFVCLSVPSPSMSVFLSLMTDSLSIIVITCS